MPDHIDEQIVAAFQRHGRAELLDVADATGIPGTTVRDRLKALEEKGVVQRFAPRVDYEAAGYARTVVVRPDVGHAAVDAVTDRLRANDAVRNVYEVSGKWNVVAIAAFRTCDAREAFVDELATASDIGAVTADVVEKTVVENEPLDPTCDRFFDEAALRRRSDRGPRPCLRQRLSVVQLLRRADDRASDGSLLRVAFPEERPLRLVHRYEFRDELLDRLVLLEVSLNSLLEIVADFDGRWHG